MKLVKTFNEFINEQSLNENQTKKVDKILRDAGFSNKKKAGDDWYEIEGNRVYVYGGPMLFGTTTAISDELNKHGIPHQMGDDGHITLTESTLIESTDKEYDHHIEVLHKKFGGYDNSDFLKIAWHMEISELEDVLTTAKSDLQWLNKHSKGTLGAFNRKDAQWVKVRIDYINQIIKSKKKDPSYVPSHYVKSDISEGKIDDKFKEWIDNASYEELLRRWRHAKSDDKIFHNETGTYYVEVMNKKEDELKPGEKTQISKRIGW